MRTILQLHVKKLFTYTYNVTYTYILTYIIRRHSSLVPIVLLVARMDSSDVGYWMHSWPIEVQRIKDTVAEWFGPDVWEEIQQFLEGGSVKEEIINSMIE